MKFTHGSILEGATRKPLTVIVALAATFGLGLEGAAQLHRLDTTVTAHHVTGRYRGVLLGDLLSLVHVPHDSLRGTVLANHLVVVGADGYRAVFALAEFDPGFTNRVAILADRKDGAALPHEEGSFHLIIPGEKRPVRWVRRVERIEVRTARRRHDRRMTDALNSTPMET